MKKHETSERSTSQRDRQHAEMLESALACPGIREVMIVYGGWQKKDRALDIYRCATKTPARTTTTNSSNAL